jgi:hypothetical protein
MGGRLVFARAGSILLSIGEMYVRSLANAPKFARAERAALGAKRWSICQARYTTAVDSYSSTVQQCPAL